jgi:predicted HTH domain antitoxin
MLTYAARKLDKVCLQVREELVRRNIPTREGLFSFFIRTFFFYALVDVREELVRRNIPTREGLKFNQDLVFLTHQ